MLWVKIKIKVKILSLYRLLATQSLMCVISLQCDISFPTCKSTIWKWQQFAVLEIACTFLFRTQYQTAELFDKKMWFASWREATIFLCGFSRTCVWVSLSIFCPELPLLVFVVSLPWSLQLAQKKLFRDVKRTMGKHQYIRTVIFASSNEFDICASLFDGIVYLFGFTHSKLLFPRNSSFSNSSLCLLAKQSL